MNKIRAITAVIFLNIVSTTGALAFIELPPGSLPDLVQGLPTRTLIFDGGRRKKPIVLKVTVTELSLIGSQKRVKVPQIGVIHTKRARVKIVMTLTNTSPSGRRATVRIRDVYGSGPSANYGRYYPVDKIRVGMDGQLSPNHSITLPPGKPTQVLLSAAIDHGGKLKPGREGMIFVPILTALRQLKTLGLPTVRLFHLSRTLIR